MAEPERSSSTLPAADARESGAAPFAGGEGEALATIDLTNRSDFNLVHRAVAKRWPLSERARDQVRAQLPALVKAIGADDRQFEKVKAIAVAMDMRHLIDSDVADAVIPRRPNRNPNRRQLRALGRQRAREALHQRVINNQSN